MPTRKTVTPFPVAASLADIDSALREQIARRAFELFLDRGGEDGHDLDDWLQAEREVLNAAGAVAIA
jgi:hypothetical protein